MDSSMPINEMLFEVFTKLDCSLVPPGFEGDARAMRAMQNTLSRVIDTIGEQSAAAQGLKRVITTTEKLRNSPFHLLYLLKDPTGLDGNGEVIGMLKVGRKHLFLFDGQDHVHEVEPICVLDFFVLPDKQRTGYGRLLFDFMLHDLEIDVHQMAIDGPSMKMERFLDRNFGVERLMKQNNNFAVSPQFFVNYPQSLDKNCGRGELPQAAYGRFGAPKPLSAIANVIHGGASYYDANQGMYPFAGVAGVDSPSQWKQFAMTAGDVSERELECDDGGLPPVADERLPEPVPWAPSTDNTDKLEGQAFWDLDKGTAHVEPTPSVNESVSSQERPKTLSVTSEIGAPPAAPAPFADVPAAGLPSTAGTPVSGCGPHRDNQLTDKGYFDVKFYHNPLW